MLASSRLRRGYDAAPLRLLVVDDSIVVRSILAAILAPLAHEFEVVAAASSAEQAFAVLDATAVDIVLLDLVLPGLDGLSALPEIVRRGRGARVLVVSAQAGEGAAACVQALTLGAADTIEKPRAGTFGSAFGDALVARLRRMRDEGTPDEAPRARATAMPAGPIGCIAIGASTGGLHALSAFFRALPARVAVPILVTQHLPVSFMPYFAAQMAGIAGRPADVATDGMSLVPGRIAIAPGDAHLCPRLIAGEVRVALDTAPAPSGCLPSVDPMFEAVAGLYGAAAFGVVLSGIGRDGTVGARAILDRGGEVVAQDRRSSTVWGMPRSVAEAGLATLVDEPALLARRAAVRLGDAAAAAGGRA